MDGSAPPARTGGWTRRETPRGRTRPADLGARRAAPGRSSPGAARRARVYPARAGHLGVRATAGGLGVGGRPSGGVARDERGDGGDRRRADRHRWRAVGADGARGSAHRLRAHPRVLRASAPAAADLLRPDARGGDDLSRERRGEDTRLCGRGRGGSGGERADRGVGGGDDVRLRLAAGDADARLSPTVWRTVRDRLAHQPAAAAHADGAHRGVGGAAGGVARGSGHAQAIWTRAPRGARDRDALRAPVPGGGRVGAHGDLDQRHGTARRPAVDDRAALARLHARTRPTALGRRAHVVLRAARLPHRTDARARRLQPCGAGGARRRRATVRDHGARAGAERGARSAAPRGGGGRAVGGGALSLWRAQPGARGRSPSLARGER